MLTVDLVLHDRLQQQEEERKRRLRDATDIGTGAMSNLLTLLGHREVAQTIRQVKDEAGLITLKRDYDRLQAEGYAMSPSTYADTLTEYVDPGHLRKSLDTAINTGLIKDDEFGQRTVNRWGSLEIIAAHRNQRNTLRPEDYWRMMSEADQGIDRGALLDEVAVLDPAPPQGWLPRFLSGDPRTFFETPIPPSALEKVREEVPFQLGHPIARTAEIATAPATLATLPFAGGVGGLATLGESVLGAGIAGGTAEALGLPPEAQMGAELVGGFSPVLRRVPGAIGRQLAARTGAPEAAVGAEEMAQTLGREGAVPVAPVAETAPIPEAPAVKPLTPAQELARARVPPVAGAEMPIPKEAMTPVAPVRTADEVLDYWASAPKSEKAQRTVVREYSGRVNADLDSLDQTVRQMQDQVKASGLKFTSGPTRDIPGVVLALDYEGPLDDALRLLQLSPEEEALARGLRGAMDQETALLRLADPDFTFREYYWPHEFVKAPRTTSRLFQGRPVGAKPGFAKPRRLEGTLADIIYEKPDLALYTGDPVEMTQRRLYQGILYRQQQVMLNNLKAKSLARPLSSLDDATGWRTPKGVVGLGGKDPWVVPDEIARALEDHFGVSAFSSNVPLNVLRQTVATLKFVKTFGGLFQHFDYSMRVLATATKARDVSMVATIPKAFARGFVPGLDAKMRRWDLVNPMRQAIIKHGINTQAGLQFIGPEYAAMAKEFWLYRIPLGVGRMLKAFGSGTFVNAHREYMLDIGEKLGNNLVKGGMTIDEAGAKVALDMNERFSSLPAWQSVLRNPTTRDVVRTGLFSMAEQESWIRMPFRQKAFFGALLVNTIALSNMVNLVVTGKPLPLSSYIPFTPKEGRLDPVTGKPRPISEYIPFMGGGYNTAFLRPELPFKGPTGQTEYLDLLGQADTPLRMIGDPKFALTSRLGQVPGAVGQIVAGESAFGGEPLTTPKQVGMFLAEQASPIPAAGFWGEQKRIGIPGAVIQALGLNVSPQRLGDLRNAVSREEFGGKEFRQLTPEEAQQFYANHPELQAETDRVTKEATENGEPWAVYRTQYTEVYESYNNLLATVPATASGQEKRDAMTNARIALSASLYRIEQDPRFADILKQRRERDAGLLDGTIEPYNRAELLLAQRAQIYDTYRGPMGQVTDQDALNEALDSWETGLSDADLKTLDDNTGLRLTVPWVKERREGMKQLTDYFDIPEQVYQANKDKLGLAAPSYTAYRTQADEEARANAQAQGLGPEMVGDQHYSREYRLLGARIERERERYRRANPDKVSLMIELGYKPPSKADIARARRTEQPTAPISAGWEPLVLPLP